MLFRSRFRQSASAYLSRTPSSSPTNAIKWTWSAWVKRGKLGSYGGLFDAYSNSSNWSTLMFTDTDNLVFYNLVSGADAGITSNAVFRDPSAWYHIVFVYDSAQATASNRVILYINGVLQTVTTPYGAIAQNEATYLNNGYASKIGLRTDGSLAYDGYMTEINFIDGQALTPSSFGQTSSTTGVWQPKQYTGTYGTNGFYLKFSDIEIGRAHF